ncbi:MAG TPA: prolyl oligopeptidase family serine peptidase [Gemmatimonadales bacterium]
MQPRTRRASVRFWALPLLLVTAAAPRPAAAQDSTAVTDPFRWLEDVEGERALTWVEARNTASMAELQAHPWFATIQQDLLEIITSQDRIAYPSTRGDVVYNFWTDAQHERGIYRRTSIASYLSGTPAWETVLDIDALAEKEGVKWAYRGMSCLGPEYRHCLVNLSRGGSDATELREFDLVEATFVDGGFFLPEAKSAVGWVDQHTLLVGTNWGEGSLTTSGYARIAKVWRRGTPLASAETLFEGKPTDVAVFVGSFETVWGTQPVIFHRPSFFEGTLYLLRDGKPVAVEIPRDADPGLVGDQLTVYVRDPWEVGGRTWGTGSVIAIKLEDFLAGSRDFRVVVQPGPRATVQGVTPAGDVLLVSVLDNVRGQLWMYRFDGQTWVGERVGAPDMGSVNPVDVDLHSNRFFFTYSSYLQPTTLYIHHDDGRVEEVRRLPAMFDATGLVIEQYEATSKDGTQVPYWLVHRENLERNGHNPTLLYGYGGFEISSTSGYSATVGKSWLERGGAYAVANIRGGGEFGPAWHRAALKEHRQRAYDDFLAVAEDLITRGVTSAGQLGIQGGSNGGLLTGVALTQRPDLFGAVVINVPLLDMRRYNKLLAGASWMAEYGNPDKPDEWAYIAKYSPYQNVRADKTYPRPLFTTTTRDDRVHPGHARKMAALMLEQGHDVLYYENTEGGHGAGVTPEQRARMMALTYTYLWTQLREGVVP